MKSEWLHSGIYAILDCDLLGWTTAEALEAATLGLLAYGSAAAAAGACALQLRAKSLPSGSAARAAAYEILRQRLSHLLPVLVNDDVAAAQVQALSPDAGVHLGQDDMAPWEARIALGEEARVGLSTHNLAQVQVAATLPVDYLGFGPVRPTGSKQRPDAVTGFDLLRAAVAIARQPVVAIGGLGAEDLAQVRGSGARSAAVISAWLGPAEAPFTPEQAGRALAELRRAWETGG